MPVVWDEDKSAYAMGAAISNATNAAGAPTQAEFNNFVAQFNALLVVLRDAGVIAAD